jgi:hypothetical protein
MSDNNDVITMLSRTNELLAVLVKAQLAPILERELAKPDHRKLYELTGGDLTVSQLSTKIGMATGTISTLWNRWEQLGLLVKTGKRYRRLFA